ncbi:MAG: hypothetical protein CMF75_00105 [Maricaulis sp.]|nr:hypothetical protein [Maricaulis sp.]|tara:strand:- start:23 stop:517 length:495 start_codon:yes stop_codon:yes gene_type:complete
MSDDIVMSHGACANPAPFRYRGCGLDNVYLVNGYEVEHHNGQDYVSVKEVEKLHRAIGMHLVMNRKDLNAKEVRFLRKSMELTQGDLASLMGTSDQSVARWEKKDAAQGLGPAQNLLKLIYISHISGEINALELVESFHDRDDGPAETRLAYDGETWADCQRAA